MRCFCLILLGFITVLGAEIQDTTSQLSDLIEATKKSLEAEITLKQNIEDYQSLFDRYSSDPENRELLLQVTKSAHKAMKIINEHHLEQLFDSKFLSELSLFDQVASKRGLPKP